MGRISFFCAVIACAIATPIQAQTPSLTEIGKEVIKSAAEQAEALRKQSEPKPTYYEIEAQRYAEAAKQGISPEWHTYWQRNLEIADRLDRRQITVDTANELAGIYFRQAQDATFARLKAEGDTQRAAQARELEEARRKVEVAAILQAQEEAQRRQNSANFFESALKLLAPQSNAPFPRAACQPNYACMSDCQRKGYMPGYCNAQCGCP